MGVTRLHSPHVLRAKQQFVLLVQVHQHSWTSSLHASSAVLRNIFNNTTKKIVILAVGSATSAGVWISLFITVGYALLGAAALNLVLVAKQNRAGVIIPSNRTFAVPRLRVPSACCRI